MLAFLKLENRYAAKQKEVTRKSREKTFEHYETYAWISPPKEGGLYSRKCFAVYGGKTKRGVNSRLSNGHGDIERKDVKILQVKPAGIESYGPHDDAPWSDVNCNEQIIINTCREAAKNLSREGHKIECRNKMNGVSCYKHYKKEFSRWAKKRNGGSLIDSDLYDLIGDYVRNY
jgi:hypothetical protein